MPLPETDTFAQAPLSSSTADVEWNKMRDQLIGLRQFVGNNYQIRPADGRQPYITDIFLAVTTETPCRSSDNAYTDARYFVKRAVAPSDPSDATYAKDGTGTNDINVQEDPSNNAAIIPSCVTATNLAELPPGYLDGADLNDGQGCHLLQDGTMVLVFGLRDSGSLGKKWYVFNQPYPDQLVIAASSARPGVYTAHPVVPDASAIFITTGTSPVTVSDLGATGSQTVIFVNESEMNKDPSDPTQHDLHAGETVTGRYCKQDDSSPSRPVFIGRTFHSENCSG